MHTLTFLDPGHFHAALTLRERHPLVRDEIVVYAPDGPELDAFVTLVDAFNHRAERPTAWRLDVRAGERSLERLVGERRGDVVVLAGKNDRKMALVRRLHDAGFHVLADKPWITTPEALADVRHVLGGGPVAMEIMTGRHEVTSIVAERLVRERDVFGGFGAGAGEPAISLASVHHLEKRVNGAPLRRPAWYFDVRVQGDGLADIPTHLVDQAQRLVREHDGSRAREAGEDDGRLTLLHARRWPTLVPRALFSRVTGLDDLPAELRDLVTGDTLAYLANCDLAFRLHGVDVELTTRWELSEPPGGGDTHAATIRGARADVRVEQSAVTDGRRRVFVEPRGADSGAGDAVTRTTPPGREFDVGAALARAIGAWRDLPGVAVMPTPCGFEIEIPAALRTGHESHFPLVLDELIRTIGRKDWPDERAADTLAKYELLGHALEAAR